MTFKDTVTDQLFLQLTVSRRCTTVCFPVVAVGCDVNCASGCDVQGENKCDTLCNAGYVLSSSSYTCQCKWN